MWDFEESIDDTQISNNEARKPIEWVAFAPPLSDRSRLHASKRNKGRRSRAPKNTKEVPLSRTVEGEASSSPAATDRDGQSLTLGIHNRHSDVQMLEAEDDEGNVEYKLRIKQSNPIRFQQLVTQLQFRLSEGSGTCFYYLGVEDDGYMRGLNKEDLSTSLEALKAMAEKCSARLVSQEDLPGSNGRICLIVEISHRCPDELAFVDICVAVAGAEGSGKSTLVAMLSNGHNDRPLLDNGQGSARLMTLKHKHEIESGKTSSLGQHLVAYTQDGRVLNYAGVAPLLPSEIAEAASSVVRLVDLGGSQKGLKTAFYGLTGLLPKFALLCICPLSGIQSVTRQHLAVALALGIPLGVVITKADIAGTDEIASTIAELRAAICAAQSLQDSDCDLQNSDSVQIVMSEQEAQTMASRVQYFGSASGLKVPVFKIASTSGEGLQLLHTFLSNLSHSLDFCNSSFKVSDLTRSDESPAAYFVVDEILSMKSLKGQVASGTLVRGCIRAGQKLFLGPTATANFKAVTIKSIERAQVPVKRLKAGQVATLLYEQDKQLSTKPVASSLAEQLESSKIRPRYGDNDSTVMYTQKAPPECVSEHCQSKATTITADKAHIAEPDCIGVDQSSDQIERQSGTDRRHDEWQSSRAADTVPEMMSNALLRHGDGQVLNDQSDSDSDAASDCSQHRSAMPLDLHSGLCPKSQVLDSSSGAELGTYSGELLQETLSFESSSLTNCRKGTVLLDCLVNPAAIWEFEAILVVFGGFWPARGLLSGSWPVMQDSGIETACHLPSHSPNLGRSPKARSFKSKLGSIYTPVVHCDNVRQAARVISMHEKTITEPWTPEGIRKVVSVDLGCALSAAKSLAGSSYDSSIEGNEHGICIAAVRFRFQHEPVWMQTSTRMIVRDRTESCLSGAGIVTRLFDGAS